MRHFVAGLLALILVVLVGIAFQLQTIARELNRLPVSTPGFVSRTAAPAETREQRNERIQRQQRELEQDVKAMWETPPEPTKKAPASRR